jgi:predicted Zn-dependent protease
MFLKHKNKKSAIIFTIFCVISLMSNFAISSSCYANPSIIRDREIEKFLYQLARPIFLEAGLNPDEIKIYIINDDNINAFVSQGQKIFINTGLIRKFKTPDALIGVIAHETGHIASGHLARSQEGMKEAENAMLLSYLLGIGAVVGGSIDAGSALILGGSQSAQKLMIKYTRTQEEAADSLAIDYLSRLSYPATGLVELLNYFNSQMIGYKDHIDEYMLSHPISAKRIELIKARTIKQNFSSAKINQKLQPVMEIALAKLEGFLERPDELIKKYKDSNSFIGKYVKAIAYFRQGELSLSLENIDALIKEKPKQGFLYDLKGQILFESSKNQQAIIAYSQAISKLNSVDNALTKISFALSLLSLKNSDEELIQLAISRLKEAQKFEDDNPILFKNLANAYAKLNDEANANLALAEFNLLINDKEKCLKLIKKVEKNLDKKNPNHQQQLLYASDLKQFCTKDDDK